MHTNVNAALAAIERASERVFSSRGFAPGELEMMLRPGGAATLHERYWAAAEREVALLEHASRGDGRILRGLAGALVPASGVNRALAASVALYVLLSRATRRLLLRPRVLVALVAVTGLLLWLVDAKSRIARWWHARVARAALHAVQAACAATIAIRTLHHATLLASRGAREISFAVPRVGADARELATTRVLSLRQLCRADATADKDLQPPGPSPAASEWNPVLLEVVLCAFATRVLREANAAIGSRRAALRFRVRDIEAGAAVCGQILAGLVPPEAATAEGSSQGPTRFVDVATATDQLNSLLLIARRHDPAGRLVTAEDLLVAVERVAACCRRHVECGEEAAGANAVTAATHMHPGDADWAAPTVVSGDTAQRTLALEGLAPREVIDSTATTQVRRLPALPAALMKRRAAASARAGDSGETVVAGGASDGTQPLPAAARPSDQARHEIVALSQFKARATSWQPPQGDESVEAPAASE